jgi:hypothetical protein
VSNRGTQPLAFDLMGSPEDAVIIDVKLRVGFASVGDVLNEERSRT